jgi:hypothetical protein
MKKITLIFLLVLFALPLSAQHEDAHRHGRHRDVTEIVKDLNAMQKRKVENISNESRERVAALRKQQRAVHDSIVMFMEREGDQSQVLYPLFEREAKLQTAINHEMYATKLRIDEVLKPEQREALRAASRKHKANPKQ